jgi:beta-glucanase (GH16 family)
MKNFLFSIALLFIGTSLYSQEVLVWSDEFNIDGAIDSSKWFHQTQLPSGGNWYNNEEQHYTDRLENSYVSNGILNIVAKKEEYTEQGVTKQYTSARLNSKEVFKYGRMVIRAKLPSGTGTWPAIWMLGKNINEDGGYWDSSYGTTAWPACGEIDIMEHWGKNQNFVQSAMHTPSSYGGTINHGGQNISTASSDFHEYELDWNAERMIFSVDGVEHYTYNPSTKNACEWPYDAEQYFLLNIAIEQGGADITETAMEIDYIRVYQNAEGYASSNTTLIDLKLDGETINDFNCTSPSSYTVTLPNNASVPLTTATPTDTNANVSITAASSIPGNTIIEVMAEDGITTENYTIYFVTNTNTNTTPTIAAPSPTKASSDVISVFSDVYTSISTDTDPNWGQNTNATEIDINGNTTLKYENLNYQGLNYEEHTDVSSMEYIHLDYYTNDASAFEFYVISHGPQENPYNIATNEGIILGQWVSIDIPLNNYTVPDLSNLFQFKTVGNGTLFLDNLYFWKESSNTWTGNTNNNWDTATNWSRNTIPTEGTDVFIPASLSNYPTANSSVTVNSVAMASGSSLIATEAFSGNITYTRNLETNNWYLISSPILGETYDNEFVSANGLASSGLNNAIAKYQTSDDSWNYMQNGESHSFNPGTGYSVRRTSGSGEISFTGTLNVNNTSISLTTSGNGYNLVGNPYPSYINSNSMLSSNTESLLTETLWVWNQTVYEPKNLASNFILSPGQGFFVQSDGDTGNLSINENNQIHQSNDTFQKGVSKSEIHLTITDGSSKRDTNIYYIEGTTTSFDNGYDSPIFNNGGNDFGIYTHLVSNSEGNDYGIQSLPHKDFEKIVVPLGINAISGSMITITGEKKNFPEAINVYIEDKEEETFTLLDTSSHFTTTLSTDLNGIGRFYIHTASKTLNTNYFDLKNNVSINACSKNKLCINGIKNGAVKVRIYDILGKQVLMASFEGNSVNNISLPSNLNEGVYIVQLITEKETLVKKIRM